MSDDDNRIDLSSVNKEPSQPTLQKVSGLFAGRKKAAGPGRDHLGQFASGGTKLKAIKGFQWSRALPIVAVVSLVGGFLVWRSFAATTLYVNQYSVYQCSNGQFNKSKINAADKCVQSSAEALAYRYYKAIGSTPDTATGKGGKASGYAFWTQRFAGDRVTPTDAGSQFIAGSKTASAKSSQAFIESLYQNLLGRKADPSGLKYWRQQLDSKKWSRGKVLAHFATQEQAKKVTQAQFANFLSKAPQVKINETAKKDRDIRLVKSTSNANESEKLYNTIKGLPAAAKKEADSAKSISSKRVPSLSDLKTIAANEKAARGYASRTNTPRNKLNEYNRQNKAFYDRAKAVSAYSPDISADGIKKQYDRTVVYSKVAGNANTDITNAIRSIASYYKVAEQKYEADQIAKKKAAEEAARRTPAPGGGNPSPGGGGGGGSNPAPGGGGGSVDCDSVPLEQLFTDPVLAEKCAF